MKPFLYMSAFFVLSAGSLAAQEKDKNVTIAKLKEIAADSMKKADVKDPHFAESENLVLATTLPESKAKSVVESLQKTYLLASKVLKFEEAEIKSFRGVIYTFADIDHFRQFQRSVLKTRPEDDEVAVSDVKRDIPFLAVSARRGEKAPNFETLAANEVCRALLQKKGGNARLAEWMKDGFARAVQMRVSPATIGSDRGTVARMAPRLGKNAKGVPVADKAWSGTAKEKDLIAASLMDYFTFGSGAESFGKILSGLIPGDNGGEPSFMDALKASDMKLEDLDREWRDWLAKGSPASK